MKGFFQKLTSRADKKSSHTTATTAHAPSSPPQTAQKNPGKNKAKPEQNHDKEWFKRMVNTPAEPDETRFVDLKLHKDLLHGIYDLGFFCCTPIQAQSLPHSLLRQDIIGHAQTGTGKTAAFLITIINTLLNNPSQEQRYAGEPRAAVIAPTRELALQISKDALALCKHTSLNIVTLIGGIDYEKQRDMLQNQIVDLVIATPGRLIDFIQQKAVFLDQVEVLVLDEADRMLDMGFIPQVTQVIRATPVKESRQTLLFSATFTPEILSLSERWTSSPISISITPERVATDTIDQRVYLVTADEKFRLLNKILQQADVGRTIIFANRRDETRRLADYLNKKNINCSLLSGEVAQNKRIKTLENFRSGKVPVLVATDVAGRGIHVDDVSHVINFSLPEDPEDYIHRIGRTGRAGSKGIAISFACEDDSFLLPAIETLLGETLTCCQPPESLTH